MTPSKFTIAPATASALCLAIACSSNSSTKSECDRLFDVVFVKCSQQPVPAGELGRLRQRFEQLCQNALALPGVALTGDTLNACVNAYEAAGCYANTAPPECSKPGTLAAGKPCNTGAQCQSNSCSTAPTISADGGSSTSQCGSCTAIIPVGQPCGAGQGSCAFGSVCGGAAPNPTCVATVYGDVGAKCGSAGECKSGLYCDFTTNRCAARVAAGAPCTQTSACAYPLSCLGTPPNESCQSPQQAGAPCSADQNCASGLGCDTLSQKCAAITWASSGQPCGGLTRCLEGNCSAASGQCPVVIADNHPCDSMDPSTTCDGFASCTSGTCILTDSTVCK